MRVAQCFGTLALILALVGVIFAHERAGRMESSALEAVPLAPALERAVPPPRVVLIADPDPPFLLRLSALNTGERLALAGPFGAAATTETANGLARFFRARSGHEVPVDGRLVELLARIAHALGGTELVVVSGHREPGGGTSRKSFHVRGMAADIAARGVDAGRLREIALAQGAGGVGLYPDFVHVDIRDEPYRWVGGRWPRR